MAQAQQIRSTIFLNQELKNQETLHRFRQPTPIEYFWAKNKEESKIMNVVP
jgi:hypothetical protein